MAPALTSSFWRAVFMSAKNNPPPPGDFPALSEEDRLLWQAVTDGVRPLAVPDSSFESSSGASPAEPASPVIKPQATHRHHRHKSIHGPAPTDTARRGPPHLEHGVASGVDKRTLRRLVRGRKSIEARLDLHGQTREQARASLVAFIRHSHDVRRRCVLVITGKGLTNRGPAGGDSRPPSAAAGVLRRVVPRWLNEPPLRPLVLAFSHATPAHGGEGALYVLLKRKK